ncbi:MAG: RIP metalloprotease RseP [Bacteroidales bacterium]|nr:RIP metalloprotease RseP [Bacteroidales bacterium]
MEILIKTGQFLLSISILVVLHEFGHFAFAKLFKTRVEKFYLFFNPWFSLFKFKKGETEYGMGWIPLGGYVKISGMIDESMDKEQMKQPAQPYEFRAKKSWQRLLIMLGGVMVNFVTALVIYSAVLYTWGDQYLPNNNVEYGIVVDSLAHDMGLRNGDKIISIDNNKVDDFHQIMLDIVLDDSKTVQIKRSGENMEIPVPETLRKQLLHSNGFIDVRIPFYIGGFVKDFPAEKSGLKLKDRLIAINGNPTEYYDEFSNSIANCKNKLTSFSVLRDKDTLNFDIQVSEEGMIGVYAEHYANFLNLEKINYSLMASVPAGIDKGIETFKSYLKQLKLIFSPKTEAYKSLGGFITIGKIFPGTWNWQAFWNLTAFLSIILAIMNVLPIPALDGGHVMFLLYEMITGRKPSDKFLEYAQIAGMVLLLALLIFANGNDIFKLFNK